MTCIIVGIIGFAVGIAVGAIVSVASIAVYIEHVSRDDHNP